MNRTDELRARKAQAGHDAGSSRETLCASLGSDPWATLHQLHEAGKRKARAAGVAYELEHKRKVVLARIANEIASAQPNVTFSEAKLDRLARADERYGAHIKATAEALSEREEASSYYWAMNSGLEWDRAAVAHTNALTRLGEPG